MNRQKNRLILFLTLFLILPGALFSQPAKEQTPAAAPKAGNEQKAVPAIDIGNFTYTSKERRDPFEPIYLQRMKKQASGPSQKPGYELEELKLVGVMKTGTVKSVMMEDKQGKGMLFKKGDFLNNNLWIKDILEDKVVLAYKLKGDTKNIEMDIPRRQER